MKKTLRLLPVLTIIAAAALCLSFDNNGKLSLSSNDEQSELFQTIPPGKEKAVADRCPDGVNLSLECQTGGSLDCTPSTCPPEN